MQNTINKSFTVISICLLAAIIAVLIFNCISKSYHEAVSSILKKNLDSQIAHYKKYYKLNSELREFRHDYKNHMICLQALIEKGQFDDAGEYIQKITHHNIIEDNRFFTGNHIADAILSDKSEQAAEVGAEIKFNGSIYDGLSSEDVCIILSNALDNSVEACEKLNSDSKIITVKCAFVQNIQLINITNPTVSDVEIYNNMVSTTKEDKHSHGIGLYNIRRTVAKYDGEFSISCENGVFTLDIGFQVK